MCWPTWQNSQVAALLLIGYTKLKCTHINTSTKERNIEPYFIHNDGSILLALLLPRDATQSAVKVKIRYTSFPV